MSKNGSRSTSPHEGLSAHAAGAAASAHGVLLDTTPIDISRVPKSRELNFTNQEHSDLLFSKAPSLHNMPVDKPTRNHETLSLSNEPRRSVRVKVGAIKQQILDAINMQAQINTSLHKQINRDDISFARYTEIKVELNASKRHVHQLYNEYRVLSGEPDKAVTQQIDKLTHDNDELCSQIDQIVSGRSVRSKTLKALSHKSRSSAGRSQHSSSTSCSTTSSILRQKQSEANAKLAELEMQLQASNKTQAIQEQLTKLENAKKTIELESQIEAEKRKAVIYSQALAVEECEGSGLLLTTNAHSEPDVPANTMKLTTSSVPSKPPVITKPQREKARHQSAIQISHAVDSDSEDDNIEPEINMPIAQTVNQKHLIRPSTATHFKVNATPIATSLQQNTNSEQHSPAEPARAVTMAYQLPLSEPKIFDGNSLEYPRWALSFDNLIGKRPLADSEKLDYMGKYLGGKALEAINGYFLLQSETAYVEARAVLDARFGDPFTVAQGFRNKLEHWSTIKPRDHDGLRKFIDFLLLCKAAKVSIDKLSFLENHEVHKQILAKLPEFITRQWVRKATKYQKKYNQYPSFEALCNFLSIEFEMSCNPMYADIYASKASNSNDCSKQSRNTSPKKTYVTQHNGQTQSSKSETVAKECVYCNMKNHSTAECGKFGRLSFDEQQTFMRDKQLCFSCLTGGHSYKQCEQPAICKICQGKHPTALHSMRTSTTKQQARPNLGKSSNNEQSKPVATNSPQPKAAESLNTVENPQ